MAPAAKLIPSIKLPRGMNREAFLERMKSAQKQILDYVNRLNKIPNLDCSAQQDTLGFSSRRVQEYYKQMISDVYSEKGLEDLAEHAPHVVTYAQNKYQYLGRDAYEALEYACEILKELGVINI